MPLQQGGMQVPFVYPLLTTPWPFLVAGGAYSGGCPSDHWNVGCGAQAELPQKPAMSRRKGKSLITLAAEAQMQGQQGQSQQQQPNFPQQSLEMLQQQQKQLAEAAIKAEADLSMTYPAALKMSSE